jgi:asparagine synthase (glutamine-hydrolysing)
MINPIAKMLPVSTDNMSFDFKLKQFLKGIPYEPAVRNQIWLGSFSKREQKDILKPEIYHSLNGFNPYCDLFEACENREFRDQIEQIIYLYSRFYLSDGILTKIDRASMATSLEVRSPFLDVELAQFINCLPSNMKIRGITRKYILKKSLQTKLPKQIIERTKKGFGIPLAKWFKKELKTYLLDYFSYSRIKSGSIFEPEGIQKIVNDHLNGKKDNRKKLWTLLMFETWKDNYGI